MYHICILSRKIGVTLFLFANQILATYLNIRDNYDIHSENPYPFVIINLINLPNHAYFRVL